MQPKNSRAKKPTMTDQKKIFISSGELSGDLLGGALVAEIKRIHSDVSFFGLTGPSLREAGVISVSDNALLSVMGVVDAIKRYPKIKLLETQLLAVIERLQPDVVILIDAPGFHFQLAEKLGAMGIKCCQYVAPKLWAWGGHRAKRLKKDFDLVLGVLPFENNFFLEKGVHYQFVGSPHRDRIDLAHKKNTLTKQNSNYLKIVAGLPGSRQKEFDWMVENIFEQKKRLAQNGSVDFRWIVPIASSLTLAMVKRCLEERGRVVSQSVGEDNLQLFSDLDLEKAFETEGILFVKGQSTEVLLLANVALAASGTVTLEAALARTPTVVLYKIDDLTYELAKERVKTKYISLPNLILDKEIFPEFIQVIDNERVNRELLKFSSQSDILAKDFDRIYSELAPNASQQTAKIICERYLSVD